ncbi:MAG TPA: hypothetical protein VGJ14_12540 [Sporichthyaceae bacterium]|jgi:hypothetical protein
MKFTKDLDSSAKYNGLFFGLGAILFGVGNILGTVLHAVCSLF